MKPHLQNTSSHSRLRRFAAVDRQWRCTARAYPHGVLPSGLPFWNSLSISALLFRLEWHAIYRCGEESERRRRRRVGGRDGRDVGTRGAALSHTIARCTAVLPFTFHRPPRRTRCSPGKKLLLSALFATLRPITTISIVNPGTNQDKNKT